MKSSCRLQSELRISLLRLALDLSVASRCNIHCITCVAQGIRDMLTWRHPRLPPPHLPTNFRLHPNAGAVSSDIYNRQRGLRSLPHLREQFKPRTDDGHASPANLSCEGPSFLGLSNWFLTLVRFFVYHRIKPHNPLLVQVPVYSFEF